MGYFNIVAMLNTLRTYLLTLLTISEGYDIVNNITRYCESVAISKFVCVTEWTSLPLEFTFTCAPDGLLGLLTVHCECEQAEAQPANWVTAPRNYPQATSAHCHPERLGMFSASVVTYFESLITYRKHKAFQSLQLLLLLFKKRGGEGGLLFKKKQHKNPAQLWGSSFNPLGNRTTNSAETSTQMLGFAERQVAEKDLTFFNSSQSSSLAR